MLTKAVLTALTIAATAAAASASEDPKQLAAAGKSLIQEFAGTLKAELVAGIEAGGPVNAIEVCKARAPEIAADVSARSDGWSIGRSSHRLRNPANAPDAYTAAAIEEFLAREAAGEAAADLAKAEIVDEEGGRVFRMVKAIPTGDVCLACHGGDEVTAEVVDALATLYPDDMARGFSEGRMRGVFTLKKPLE